MTSNLLTLAFAVALGGCATTSPQAGDTAHWGTAAVESVRTHVRTVRDHLRAERRAMRAALGEPGQPVARVIEVRPPQEPMRAPVNDGSPLRMSHGHPARDSGLPAIQMDVGLAEMITPQGTIHSRAAQALARMDAMAREEGGEFTVSVPRAHIETAAVIRQVAPGATILSVDGENYRLTVIPVDD